MKRKRIVIIGGGFAGLNLARKLAKANLYDIVLVDKQNHHMFQPLFYQVASARLEPSSISFPFRALFRRRKTVEFRYATVEKIDPEKHCVQTSMGDIPYDKLVIATGCRTNFFGNENLKQHTMAMKTTQQTTQRYTRQVREDHFCGRPRKGRTDEPGDRWSRPYRCGAFRGLC